MTQKTKIAIALVSLLIAFAFGRFSAPEHIKTEIKTVEVEKKSDQKEIDKQNHKKTTTVTEIKPDGSKKIITVTTDESDTKTQDIKKDNIAISNDTTKEVSSGGSKVTISALAGINPFKLDQGIDYGAMVSKPIIGPITLGAFGFKSGSCGVSVGLTF